MWWGPNCVLLTNHIFLFKWAFKVKDAALLQTLGVETKGSQVSILQPRPNRPGTCDLKPWGGGCYACECPHQSFPLLQGLLFPRAAGVVSEDQTRLPEAFGGTRLSAPSPFSCWLKRERILLRTHSERWQHSWGRLSIPLLSLSRGLVSYLGGWDFSTFKGNHKWEISQVLNFRVASTQNGGGEGGVKTRIKYRKSSAIMEKSHQMKHRKYAYK